MAKILNILDLNFAIDDNCELPVPNVYLLQLRRYQSHNKEMRNLMEYLKTLMLDFFRWSGAMLSGKRPSKKHHKKKGMFYRPFTGRKESSDIEMRSMHSSFVKPLEL